MGSNKLPRAVRLNRAMSTHGHIQFLDTKGEVVSHAYAYHDGHTDIAIEDILQLPRILVERWAMFYAFRHPQERLLIERLVPLPSPINRLMKRYSKSSGKKVELSDLEMDEPDFMYLSATALANLFCGLYVDRWQIMPVKEMSYPGIDLIIRDEGHGVFHFFSDRSSVPIDFRFNWTHELLLCLRIYDRLLPGFPGLV